MCSPRHQRPLHRSQTRSRNSGIVRPVWPEGAKEGQQGKAPGSAAYSLVFAESVPERAAASVTDFTSSLAAALRASRVIRMSVGRTSPP